MRYVHVYHAGNQAPGIAAAFAVSLVLYVAYYRMEEMKAFYAAMVPLVTEAAAMAVLTVVVITGRT